MFIFPINLASALSLNGNPFERHLAVNLSNEIRATGLYTPHELEGCRGFTEGHLDLTITTKLKNQPILVPLSMFSLRRDEFCLAGDPEPIIAGGKIDGCTIKITEMTSLESPLLEEPAQTKWLPNGDFSQAYGVSVFDLDDDGDLELLSKAPCGERGDDNFEIWEIDWKDPENTPVRVFNGRFPDISRTSQGVDMVSVSRSSHCSAVYNEYGIENSRFVVRRVFEYFKPTDSSDCMGVVVDLESHEFWLSVGDIFGERVRVWLMSIFVEKYHGPPPSTY